MSDDGIQVFDDLYSKSADPWHTRSSWYERRKRSLLLASLPHEYFATAYEAGCGTGHITIELAGRCGALLASDASAAALAVAAPLLAFCANTVLEQHRLPQEWPSRAFDLIVFGELLYFLDESRRSQVAHLARASAGKHGTIVACDWRGWIEGWGHTGESVHRAFSVEVGLPVIFEYEDDDFLLTAWSADRESVANREEVGRCAESGES